jgi:hypothetical protein
MITAIHLDVRDALLTVEELDSAVFVADFHLPGVIELDADSDALVVFAKRPATADAIAADRKFLRRGRAVGRVGSRSMPLLRLERAARYDSAALAGLLNWSGWYAKLPSR